MYAVNSENIKHSLIVTTLKKNKNKKTILQYLLKIVSP